MMNWSNLLKCCRLGCPDEEKKHDPDRNEFQRDFDRVVFSTAFRRLHGKTQVFPFPESDSIHTRLTHSLEASCVGRSLSMKSTESSIPSRFMKIPDNKLSITLILMPYWANRLTRLGAYESSFPVTTHALTIVLSSSSLAHYCSSDLPISSRLSGRSCQRSIDSLEIASLKASCSSLVKLCLLGLS